MGCCPGLKTALAALLPEAQAAALEAKLVVASASVCDWLAVPPFFAVSQLQHSPALTTRVICASQWIHPSLLLFLHHLGSNGLFPW